ncbi:MAG: hypothetical protein L0323_16165 [Planctomycetes bacterium]|nr:hypothetical protein [Planctomycetota bacterium]
MKTDRDEEGFLRRTLEEIRAREGPPPPFVEVVESGRRARASRRRRLAVAAALLLGAIAASLPLVTRGGPPPSPSLPPPTGGGPGEPAYRASARLLTACLRPTIVAEPLYPDPGDARRSVAPALPCWSYGRRLLLGSE